MVLLSACKEGDGSYEIQTSFLLILSNFKHPHTFFSLQEHPHIHRFTVRGKLCHFFKTNCFYHCFLWGGVVCLFIFFGDFLFSPRGQLDCRWGGRTPQRSPPSITQHKSNKTRLCKYFSGFSTSSRILLLTVCWSSE